jgi:hypothetical protein
MITEDLVLALLTLAMVLVGFIIALRPFFSPKLIVYLVAITAFISALPNVISITGADADLASSAMYITVSLFVSTLLWDSRQFLIDNFSLIEFIMYRPAYCIVPLEIILRLTRMVPLNARVCGWLIAIQIIVGAVASELTYSLAKRNDLIHRTYRRRGSIPRAETSVATPALPPHLPV